MGSVQFKIAPCSSLYFSISIGPSSTVMLPTGILICCMVPSEAVPFLYLASVCWSLQCLISALTQVGGGGLLFRFTCSVVLRGGRGSADKCHWHMQGTLTVFQPHWVCPHSGVCALLVYTAQAPSCSIWSGPYVECGSSFRVLTKVRIRLHLHFVSSPA